jgi:dTDP-glucose pyrophosphorylase
VQSVLLIEEQIDNDEELIIANCDQVMHWNIVDVLENLRQYDAGLVTINSNQPKHSYAKVENGLVTEVVEKKVISDIALTGIHYWKRGSDFVRSAKQLIADDNRSLNEFYISTTYNYLIEEGLNIGHHMIYDDEISFIGTPEDLDTYLSRSSLGRK